MATRAGSATWSNSTAGGFDCRAFLQAVSRCTPTVKPTAMSCGNSASVKASWSKKQSAAAEERTPSTTDPAFTAHSLQNIHEERTPSTTEPPFTVHSLRNSFRDSLSNLFEGSNPSTTEPPFTMFVLPVTVVLELGRIPKHEEIFDKLEVWQEGMETLFVSHTWLSRGHPDDTKNQKLQLLRAFLASATAGAMEIPPDYTLEVTIGTQLRIPAKQAARIAYIWLDFWSIPQEHRRNQAHAIRSIPAYVARCSFVACVAGSWVHEETGAPRDLPAWTKRGWCRVEVLCNGLSPVAKPLIVVQSLSTIRTYSALGQAARMWMHYPVGTADFTVDDDRRALGPVIERLVDDAIMRRAEEGTEEGMLWSRFLKAIKHRLLVGTGVDVNPITKDLWMQHLSFTSPTQADSFGWAPLTYAVIEGRVDVAEELLDAGADVEAPLQKDYPPLWAMKGATNLVLSAWFEGNGPMIQLLLSRGADATRRCGAMKHSALGWACSFSNTENAEALIEAEPRLLDLGLLPGSLPLTGLALSTQYHALDWALKRHPEYLTDKRTGTPSGWLQQACLDLGDADAIALLITQAGVDVNYYDASRMNTVFAVLTAISTLAVRLQNNPSQTLQIFAVSHATALHTAAFNGNLRAVEILLQAGADFASVAHPLKMTPLHAAAYTGHLSVCVRLLDAGAPAAACDSTKRTASMWGKRRGHDDIVLAISMHEAAAAAARAEV